ncbi:inactive ubiquitin carboxyl-terminal hydrolase MINDY-4B [Bacillus rossius redtenbacheri]|uniref:inactive ubiquitin carboxyl-terminal hydrolase MINDY-4B n=1 Tax=Bacillus rossius redtenbacheri TaxID=93214 RepID=UPI002FDEE8ED
MYPRKQKAELQKVAVVGGEPITEELAIGLRQVVFGTPVTTPRSEWLRTGLVFREAEQDLGFGLKAARNGTRGLLSVVQAHVLKDLLFHKDCGPSPDLLLKPCRARQLEALWTALSDILWRVGEKAHCRVCLPQEEALVPHSHKYFQDGLTEKLHIFEFTNYEDLFVFIKRYTFLFAEENGPGTLLLLYCAVLTRGCGKVKLDLGSDKAFLVTAAEEGSQCVVTLLLTGRATPYLHNGVVYVGDEDHYALPQFGVLARSEVGFLLWEEDQDGKMDEARQPGSRLKTPSVPVWVCCCLGHYGVLFNTNSELLRNYQAERRFDLYYYTCGGNMSVLSVDTRCSADTREARDDMGMPSLEKLIHTKWQGARVHWSSGLAPAV